MSLSSQISRTLCRFNTKSVYFSGITKTCFSNLKLTADQTPFHCARCLGSSVQTVKRLHVSSRTVSSTASENALQTTQPSSDTIDKVNHEIIASGSRLFAVVHIAAKQYKITTNDLIQIHNHIAPDIGERIRLEKVLLVGGDNFTLLGRPLLGLDQVRIEATVIEKTVSQPYIRYLWRAKTGYKKYKEFINRLTILRINSIEVSPNSLKS